LFSEAPMRSLQPRFRDTRVCQLQHGSDRWGPIGSTMHSTFLFFIFLVCCMLGEAKVPSQWWLRMLCALIMHMFLEGTIGGWWRVPHWIDWALSGASHYDLRVIRILEKLSSRRQGRSPLKYTKYRVYKVWRESLISQGKNGFSLISWTNSIAH
jgi:hypothetical protein